MGLTGKPDQTDCGRAAYRVFYRINREGDEPNYLVDYSAFTYLVLPDYGLVELLPRGDAATDGRTHGNVFLAASG